MDEEKIKNEAEFEALIIFHKLFKDWYKDKNELNYFTKIFAEKLLEVNKKND